MSNAVGSLGPKKGEGQRMRVLKAKGIIRHYFKPSPSLPSLHLSTLFTHKSRCLLMCVHGHITFPSISQSFYDRHPYSHPQQNSSCEAEGGGGVLGKKNTQQQQQKTPSFHNPPVGPSSLISPSPHYSLNPPDNTSGCYSFLSLLVPSLLSNARISTR